MDEYANTSHTIINWNGHGIRFFRKYGKWWAILDDICHILEIQRVDACELVTLWHVINIDVDNRPMLGVDCCGAYMATSDTPFVGDRESLVSWLDMVFYYLDRSGEDGIIPEYIYDITEVPEVWRRKLPTDSI